MTTFGYQVGELIEARDPASGLWRPCHVMSLAPYRGQPGYYIQWFPLPKLSEMSSGGWTHEAVMRRKGSER
jgi:hypothetical protein